VRKRIFIIGCIIIVILFFFLTRGEKDVPKIIKVEKGNIIVKATALGAIEAKNEITIKSKISGILKQFFVEVGDKIQKGAPLLEIDPTPTPIELATIRKEAEIAKIEYKNMKKEMERIEALREKNLISLKDYEKVKEDFDKAKIRFLFAKKQLNIMERGKVSKHSSRTIIKSPISGTILERFVNEGESVVPLTSYQPGTPLLSIANIDSLIFKGTVDEIDVGQIEEGMMAEITIGALPNEKIIGKVTKIAPKSKKKGHTTLFDIEIKIIKLGTKKLRVGYSATADIILCKKENVLIIPEGCIYFKKNKTFVKLANNEEREIVIGISDGLNVEIVSGLKEGEGVILK
jgi:HlyD family secretion protein